MLPRIWKKLLLAICIIACLFNVTAKIVNRVSLEKVIVSQKEGVNVRELLNITDEKPALNKQTTNTVSTYDVETENVVEEQENVAQEAEEVPEEQEKEETKTEKGMTQEQFFDKIFKENAFTSVFGN